jgi:hypothetical protein
MGYSALLNWLSASLQFFAAGALMIWPDQKWIGVVLMGVGVAAALTNSGIFFSKRLKQVWNEAARSWFLIPLGMCVGILIVWMFSLFPAFRANTDMSFASAYQHWEDRRKNLKLVQGEHFVNQEVLLDGYFYTNCTFENVRLVFEGKAPFKLYNNVINGFVFDPRSPALNDLLITLEDMNLLDRKKRTQTFKPPTN